MNSYSIKTLAERWDCDRKTIRRMIKAGTLRTFEIGVGADRKSIRVLGESVALVEQGETPEAPKTTPKSVPTPTRRWV